MHRSTVFAAFVVACLHVDPAGACSFEEGFVATIPVDGAVAPLNPLILVRTGEVSDPRLFDSDGVEVPTAASPFNANFASGVRLIPRAPLDVDASYTLGADGLSTPLATFSTGAADDEAPTILEVTVVEVTGPPSEVDAVCSNNGFATLQIDSDEPLAVVDVTDGNGRIFDLLDDDGAVTVSGIGPTKIGIVGLDAAGNSSAPVNVAVDFGQPPPSLPSCGCPVGGNDVVVGALWPIGLLGFARLRRRR